MMLTGRLVRTVVGTVPIVGTLVWAAVAFGPAQAASSEQVVFSKTGGFGTFANTPTPFGFWIWCEATSLNPYNGVCNGSMYFYALGVPKEVTGTIKESSTVEDQYTMSVHSQDNSIVCTLTNQVPVLSGPSNTVTVSCKSPGGSGTASGSVVNVTGP